MTKMLGHSSSTNRFRGLLPPPSTEEQLALRASIADQGVRDPIVVDEDGTILDGHHRFAIDPEAPRRVVAGLSEGEKQAFVFQANLARRNLSSAQKGETKKKMQSVAKVLREENPKKNTQERVAALLGVDRSTVAKWLGGSNVTVHDTSGVPRPDARVKIPPPHWPVILKRLEAGDTQEQVAADYGVTDRHIRSISAKERQWQEEKAQRESTVTRLDDWGIQHGDFRVLGQELPDDCVDLVLTDPPYSRDSVALYGELARLAARVLRPGGWCLAYSGQMGLPEVLRLMAGHLEYGWTFIIRHTGGDLRVGKYRLYNGWKPVFGFYKPPLSVWWDWFPDMVSGGREKDDHDWQQAVGEAEHFIQALCPPGGLVLDPMLGSGTTCVAAQRLGRQWVGFELDEQHVLAARERVAQHAQALRAAGGPEAVAAPIQETRLGQVNLHVPTSP